MVKKPLHPDELPTNATIVEDKVFMPYQIQVVNDEHIAQLVEKGRQEGLSWALAYKSYKRSGKEGRYPTFFATKTRILAKQFINDCGAWAKLARLIKSTVDATYEDQIKIFNDKTEEEETVNTYNIRFPNKMEVTALSSNADAMRGWRGYKIADEFALHKQQQEMLDAILPSRMWRFPFTFCSTHKGVGSEFNKLIKKYRHGDLGADWSLISIPIQRAVEEGLLEKIYKRPFSNDERQAWLQNLEREEGVNRWNQEYCCKAEDEAGSFFSYDLIISCEMEDILYDEVKKFKGESQSQEAKAWFDGIANKILQHGTGVFYLGMDIGRDVNYTVLCLIEEVVGIKFVRAIAALDQMPFTVQQACARSLIKTPRFRRACVDNRGMGRETVDRLQNGGDGVQGFGEYIVEKIDFSLLIKEKIAYAILRSLTDKTLKLPINDTIRDDFHSIRKETSDSGNVRYVAKKNDTDPNSHGDYYTAVGLAHNAAGTVFPEILGSIKTPGNEPIQPRTSRLDTVLNGFEGRFPHATMRLY